MRKFIYLNIIISLLFLSCCRNNEQKQTIVGSDSGAVVNPALNYQHLVGAVNWFRKSGEMRACYYQAYKLAKMQLDAKLAKISKNKKRAIIVDIDETLLDNSPFEVNCIETGQGYSSESWKKWTALAKAAPVPGAVEFLNYAKSKNTEVFYISNRKINELESTMKNLDSLKFPYVDKNHTLFRTEGNSKESRRKTVANEYEILLLIGDNLADFSDIFENRDSGLGLSLVEQNKEKFGDNFIILPNPMYGDWEMALYGKDAKPKDHEKGKILKEGLKSSN